MKTTAYRFPIALRLIFLALALTARPTSGGAESLPILFPALKALPAPAWIREGTRLSYSAITATVGGNLDTPGVSGESLIQVDVVALDQVNAVLQTRLYVRPDGGFHPYPATGMIGMASCAGEWWANPATFAGALPGDKDSNPSMIRMPYPVGKKTYNGIRIEHRTDPGTSVWVFDLDTGVLLFNSSSTRTGDGRNQQSSMSLVGIRTLALPWLGLQPNPLTATLGGYAGQGSYLVSVAGASPTALGISIQAQTVQRGRRWLAYRQTSLLRSTVAMPQSPDTIFAACGPGQIGGLLLPAGSVTGLAQGRTLDVDDITGARFFVAQSGGQGLVLCEELPTVSTYWFYDSRGFCSRLVSDTRGFTAIKVDVSIRDN